MQVFISAALLFAKMENKSEASDTVLNVTASSGCLEKIRCLMQLPASRAEARELCFVELNSNPHNVLARLFLARAFYLDGMSEFCLRELIELKKFSSSHNLEKLLNTLKDFNRAPSLSSLNSSSDIDSKGTGSKDIPGDSKIDDNTATIAEVELDFTEVFKEAEK